MVVATAADFAPFVSPRPGEQAQMHRAGEFVNWNSLAPDGLAAPVGREALLPAEKAARLRAVMSRQRLKE
jgi:hypothetical protein